MLKCNLEIFIKFKGRNVPSNMCMEGWRDDWQLSKERISFYCDLIARLKTQKYIWKHNPDACRTHTHSLKYIYFLGCICTHVRANTCNYIQFPSINFSSGCTYTQKQTNKHIHLTILWHENTAPTHAQPFPSHECIIQLHTCAHT